MRRRAVRPMLIGFALGLAIKVLLPDGWGPLFTLGVCLVIGVFAFVEYRDVRRHQREAERFWAVYGKQGDDD